MQQNNFKCHVKSSANYIVNVSMNSLVFKLHEADAKLRSRDMWNANRSLAEFCLCSLPLTQCLFSLLTRKLALCSSSVCVFVFLSVCNFDLIPRLG